MTHTYAVLEVSQAVYDEIKAKLEAVGYDHAFHEDPGGTVIDMHGIALQAGKADCLEAVRREPPANRDAGIGKSPARPSSRRTSHEQPPLYRLFVLLHGARRGLLLRASESHGEEPGRPLRQPDAGARRGLRARRSELFEVRMARSGA